MDLDTILARVDLTDEQRGALRALLLAREDNMVGIALLAAQQLGMYPQLVAEVVAQIGLGTPPTEEERQIIRSNFVECVEELRRQMGEQ